LSSGSNVRGPSEPSGVTGVDVNVQVGLCEGLPRIDSNGLVGRLGIRTVGIRQVGNQVGELVGFHDGDNADGGVLGNNS